MKIQINKNNIKYLGDKFKAHFSYDFTVPKKLKLTHKVLEKSMLDKEILEEFKPKESTLGEFAWALKNEKAMLKNGWSNIFYIRDKDNNLWAVRACWNDFGGGWLVDAASVSGPVEWLAGRQVVSQRFNVSSDKLDSRIIEILDSVDELTKELRTLI